MPVCVKWNNLIVCQASISFYSKHNFLVGVKLCSNSVSLFVSTLRTMGVASTAVTVGGVKQVCEILELCEIAQRDLVNIYQRLPNSKKCELGVQEELRSNLMLCVDMRACVTCVVATVKQSILWSIARQEMVQRIRFI